MKIWSQLKFLSAFFPSFSLPSWRYLTLHKFPFHKHAEAELVSSLINLSVVYIIHHIIEAFYELQMLKLKDIKRKNVALISRKKQECIFTLEVECFSLKKGGWILFPICPISSEFLLGIWSHTLPQTLVHNWTHA